MKNSEESSAVYCKLVLSDINSREANQCVSNRYVNDKEDINFILRFFKIVHIYVHLCEGMWTRAVLT